MEESKGYLSAKDLRIAIIGSCFNAPIADLLIHGAVETFTQHEGSIDAIHVIRVPGAFEIPCTIKKLLIEAPLHYDALVACGVLIRGETSHYDHIADQVSARISQLSVEFCLHISFSIITAPSVESAWERAGIKGPNLGAVGMETAIRMANLFKQLERKNK